MFPALIARATDRALARCAEDDPPRVVALRVAVAILRDLQRAGVGVSRSPVTGHEAATLGAPDAHPADKRRRAT